MDMDATDDREEEAEKLANLRVILGEQVATGRLHELLEASSGSVERAVEIYFHQRDESASKSEQKSREQTSRPGSSSAASTLRPQQSKSTAAPRSNRGEKRSPQRLPSSGSKGVTKQARLDSFLGIKTSTTTSPSKQSRMDSFFGGGKSSSSKTTCSNPKTTPDGSTKTVASAKTDDIDMTSPVSSPISEKKPLKLSPAMELSKSINEKRSDNPHIAQISFERFAELLQQMADTTKRTIKLGALETFIREIMDTQEQGVDLTTRAHTLTSALELVLGGRTSKPLNISDSAVSKALQTSLGVSRSQLSKAYRQYGDLGDCAAGFFQKKKFFVTSSASRHLSIVQVSEALEKISVTDGRDAKQLIALSLLRKCQSKTELRFLVRLLIRFMRIGANLKTVLAALAMAVLSQGNRKKEIDAKEIKEAVAMVQKTHDICPNIGLIVCALLEGGIEQMKRDCSIQIHTPIAPMLAHPIHTMEEVEKAMRTDGCTSAVMEYKYDGMRLQAHYDGNSVKLFSRHMLETTSQFAEVAQYLIEAFKVKGTTNASFIIDAEVVGVEESGDEMNLLPFQELATRRKKNDDGKGVRVKVFVFDLMFLDGISLINEPLHKRQNLLVERFQGTSNFAFVTHQNLASFDENKILKFLTESVEHGAEGIMIKLQETGTSYEAGTRSHSWLKVKRDYVMGFADTIDVVPIGAWYGNGRKAQKSFLSPVLLAVYDDQEDVYRSISRCMSFTDEMYTNMREFYFRNEPYPEDAGDKFVGLDNIEEKDSVTHEDSESDGSSSAAEGDEILENQDCEMDVDEQGEARVNCFPNRPSSAIVVTNENPSIWFKPLEVFEVSFADLSLSRQHTAAAGLVDDEGRGIALRFPRFKRRRPDKKPEQATTSIQIAQLFSKQTKINRNGRSK